MRCIVWVIGGAYGYASNLFFPILLQRHRHMVIFLVAETKVARLGKYRNGRPIFKIELQN